MRIKWRRLNNAFHRDLGYFFFGMAIIYGLSGIALNHIDDWDPSYKVTREEVLLDKTQLSIDISEAKVKVILRDHVESAKFKKHYFPNDNHIKIFFKGGSLVANINTGAGFIEKVHKRPLFFEVNYLHYNNPKFLWTWFSDIFAGGLIVLAVTGMFMVRGRNGFKRRGIWFVSIGIIIPLIFLVLYYSG